MPSQCPKPDVCIIIPARMASTRFPGKPLADRTGKPMIQHVCDQAARARGVSLLVVATDDGRIARAVDRFGGQTVMTSADHPNGTSRLAEAADKLGLGDEWIVVNVQGDEPELEPAVIDAAVGVLRSSDQGASMSTVAVPIDEADLANPNVVKVVRDGAGRALYFSRAAIPFVRDAGASTRVRPLRHVGLYAYRRAFLRTYATLAPTDLEATEQLEQLRVLYHGHSIAVAVVEGVRTPAGIDTPEQYEAFVRRHGATATLGDSHP